MWHLAAARSRWKGVWTGTGCLRACLAEAVSSHLRPGGWAAGCAPRPQARARESPALLHLGPAPAMAALSGAECPVLGRIRRSCSTRAQGQRWSSRPRGMWLAWPASPGGGTPGPGVMCRHHSGQVGGRWSLGVQARTPPPPPRYCVLLLSLSFPFSSSSSLPLPPPPLHRLY